MGGGQGIGAFSGTGGSGGGGGGGSGGSDGGGAGGTSTSSLGKKNLFGSDGKKASSSAWASPSAVDRIKNPPAKWVQEEIGPYRGNKPGFFQGGPKSQVIFQYESKAPHPVLNSVGGALTPDHGVVGVFNSKSHKRGAVTLTIYGDPKTGKASSWTLHEWKSTGKKQPNTNIEHHSWQKVPTVEDAVKKDGFWEAWQEYTRRK